MRGQQEPVKVAESFTVILKIVRHDKVQYPSDVYDGSKHPPIAEEVEQLTIASTQDDLVRAVDMAIALLNLQRPHTDG